MEEQTNYNFNVTVMPGTEIEIRFDFNAEVFDKDSIERLKGHLVHLLEQVTDNPEITVGELELVTEAEKADLLGRFNDTKTEFPRGQTLIQLFEEQAEYIPDAAAISMNEQEMTYRELNERVNRLARTLRSHGISQGRLVAIMAERSIEMVIGILAAHKAGAAYVPIDPEYPEERIRFLIEDSGAQVMLTQSRLRERLAGLDSVILLDDESFYHEDGTNLNQGIEATDLACVIYTSGTTGKPKGNLVSHRNIVRVVQNTNYIDITNRDHVLQLSSYSFDGAIFDIFGALTNGARLVLVPRETLLEIGLLADLIQRQRISVMFITTAFFNVLVDVNVNCFRDVRAILFGGERVSVGHVRKALAHLGAGRLNHVYGPTESTIFTTYLPVDFVDESALTVPIGRPISNTTVYIVDSRNKLLPIGVVGELCVGGEGLVRGYNNRPELTAEKFVHNPFTSGERMYRTGDLAKWLPDGTIEYVGRTDDQVKIRGFRIELGEIETQLQKVEGIRKTTVFARENVSGEKQLCAYYEADCELPAAELKSVLSQELPAYMIPTYLIQLERLPLTTNGKVDRRSLPAPEEACNRAKDILRLGLRSKPAWLKYGKACLDWSASGFMTTSLTWAAIPCGQRHW